MTEREEIQKIHREFSSSAHNRAMDILFDDDPSLEEIHSLMEHTHVAHWHWMQRDDKTPQNVSVALWALSRAYSANGFANRSLAYAKASLATIENENLLPSFYGYCNEALARAYLLVGENQAAKEHYDKAIELAEKIPTPQAKEYLLYQINQIQI